MLLPERYEELLPSSGGASNPRGTFPLQPCLEEKEEAPKPVPLPEVPLADALLLDVPLLEVPLANVPQPLDPEPIDPEVAEQESSWRRMSNMSVDREFMSLLFPSLRELACEDTNITRFINTVHGKNTGSDAGMCCCEERGAVCAHRDHDQ